MTQTTPKPAARIRGLLVLLPVAAGLVGLATRVSGETAGTGETPRQTRALPIRGVVRALEEATISTEIIASVSKIGFKEGQFFKKGDLLIAFDCRRYAAELAAAKALQKEMQINVETNTFLEKRNAGSKQEIEISKARADKAGADVDALEVRIDQCNIMAPFDGRVAEIGIREHEMPVSGRPLIRVLAAGELEIDLILPSNWLAWLKTGAEFEIVIDETRKSYSGVVTRIGAEVDTISQTVKVTSRFKAPVTDVLPGMSGSAHFEHNEG